MEIALLNLFAISVVAGPLVVLELLRPTSAWLDRNHGWISVLVWMGALFVLYVYVMPKYGLEPNPAFFRDQY